jgi:type IV secretion system protein VirB9
MKRTPLVIALTLAHTIGMVFTVQPVAAQTAEAASKAIAKPSTKPVKAKPASTTEDVAATLSKSSVPSTRSAATSRVLQLTTQGDNVIDLPVQPGQLTHLVLPAGETFSLPPATGQGARCDDETHLWCIAAQGRDLFIKAKPGATTNNLIVVTERNRYAFDLRAVTRGALMRLTLIAPPAPPIVPAPFDAASNGGVRDAQAPRNGDGGEPQMVRVATPPPDPQKLLAERMNMFPVPRNTQYSMAVGKSSEDITPSLVFDDGRFTYLRFAGNRPLPAIFQNGPDGGEETVNVRMGEDDLLVTDRVARRLVLRLGQAVVVVVNDAFDIEGAPPQDGTTVPGVSRTLTQVPKPPVRLPAAMTVQQAPIRSLQPSTVSEPLAAAMPAARPSGAAPVAQAPQEAR